MPTPHEQNPIPAILYRGVNKIMDDKNGGHLIPKGKTAEVTPKLDGKWRLDGTFRHGPCESNTARAHQIESGLYDGCGISTSRSEEQAIFFATSGHIEEGFVYVIDEAQLANANVVPYEFSNSVTPHECEVTLIERSGSALSKFIIIEKYEVDSDGRRT